MKPTRLLIVAALASLCALVPFAGAQSAEPTAWNADVRAGGMGGLYLLPDEGPLWVEIEKQDLNRSGSPAHLRAILVGPDREVLDEQWIPDDGNPKGELGPVQRVRLEATVARRGLYAVNITVTNDRYGEEVLWGFSTNSPKYMVETSRGHKDEAHTEPLIFRGDGPGDVWFLPPTGTFTIDAASLPPDLSALHVYTPNGDDASALTVVDGAASATFDAADSTLPWRLHLPKLHADLHIDGVTRWKPNDTFEHMSYWTPHRDAWFPLHHYRWLVTPYNTTVYTGDSPEGESEFTIHNNGTTEQTIALTLEADDDAAFALSQSTITLRPKQSESVTIRYNASDRPRTCYLRATPQAAPGMSTFAALHVRPGQAPAAQPIAMPLVLKPYQHENAQFGYTPNYPLTNEVYFDANNAPFITDKRSWQYWRDGQWRTLDRAAQPGGEPAPFELLTTKLAFDRDNRAYTLARQDGATVLLCADDGADTATAYPIPGGGSFDLEQFSGHNAPTGPPPFVRYTLTERDPKLFWRRLHDMHLFVPRRNDNGSLTIGEPILLSKKSIGYSGHSGKPSSLVSRGGKIHIAWAEATEPDENAPGVPTFVATHDTETGETTPPVLVGYGPPANDVHNTPCITVDSRGYLHVLIGTHGRTFRYARSLQPNTASAGFTESEELGPGLRQTYIGLVCDPDDTLHAVFRLWRTDTTYFPAGHYACLAYMTKPANSPWSEAKPLIISPFSEYSVFYHRLTVDRRGALVLSYDYWSTFWFYRNDHQGTRRALLTSPDHGATWKLAAHDDLVH